MKSSFILFCLCVFLIFSCKKKETFKVRHFSSIAIQTILEDSLLSIRAIDILDDGSLAFAANNGVFGLYNPLKNTFIKSHQTYDSLNIEFRAIGHTATDFFMLSVGNPALLYKTGSLGTMELVYKEAHANVFYDALRFWNNQEGIAIGDPTNDCLSILITRDGGKTWKKIDCNVLPKIKDGEAAFAASNTNIAIVGNQTWVATGGKASRVLYSADTGKTWTVFETPIVQGLETTGVFSIDFYDALQGFAVGGDYAKPDAMKATKIKTMDGGKTWQRVGHNKKPGYRSCVQFIPNRRGFELVAVGNQGIDFSNDSGNTWNHLSHEGFHTIRFLNDRVAYAAGAGRISKLTFRE